MVSKRHYIVDSCACVAQEPLYRGMSGTEYRYLMNWYSINIEKKYQAIKAIKMEELDREYLLGVVVIVFSIFGIFGNVISFTTWTFGKKCQTFPGTMYFRTVALSDTLVLCSSATHFAVLTMFGIELKDLHDIPCKMYDALGHFGALLTTWCTVSLAIQRTIAVTMPSKSDIWDSKANELVVITTSFMLFLFLNLCYGLAFNMVSTQSLQLFNITETTTIRNATHIANGSLSYIMTIPIFKTGDIPSDASSLFTNAVSTTVGPIAEHVEHVCIGNATAVFHKYHALMIDTTLLLVTPFTLIIICCAILVIAFIRQNDEFEDRHSHKRDPNDPKGNVMTARIVTLGVTHCALVGPYAIMVLLSGISSSTSSLLQAIYFLHHSIKVLFYSFIGKTFRTDWTDMFCKCKRFAKEQQTLSPKVSIESKL